MKEYEKRIVCMILFTIIVISKAFSEEREKNITFISDLLKELSD